jgi:hypothetical protein
MLGRQFLAEPNQFDFPARRSLLIAGKSLKIAQH